MVLPFSTVSLKKLLIKAIASKCVRQCKLMFGCATANENSLLPVEVQSVNQQLNNLLNHAQEMHVCVHVYMYVCIIHTINHCQVWFNILYFVALVRVNHSNNKTNKIHNYTITMLFGFKLLRYYCKY